MELVATQIALACLTIPEVTRYYANVRRTRLHHVTAGEFGTQILLIHHFPENWSALHKLTPLMVNKFCIFELKLLVSED